MSNNDSVANRPADKIDALRQLIQQAFPPATYSGRITPHDDKLDDPALDDERDLYGAMKGRRWTDVPKQILQNQPDGYVLLNEEAFAAFIPAWLMYSLENIDGDNEVRDFVVYAFSPKHDSVPDTTEFIVRRLRTLNPNQRDTLRSLLMEFAERSSSSFQRKLASAAVGLIDTLS